MCTLYKMYQHCSASTNTEYKFLSSTDSGTLHCLHLLALFHNRWLFQQVDGKLGR